MDHHAEALEGKEAQHQQHRQDEAAGRDPQGALHGDEIPVEPEEDHRRGPHEEHEEPHPQAAAAAAGEKGVPHDLQIVVGIADHGQHEGPSAEQDEDMDEQLRQLHGQDEEEHGDIKDHGAELAVPPGKLHVPRGLHHRQAQEALEDLLQGKERKDPVEDRIAEGEADEQRRLGQLVCDGVQHLPQLGNHMETPGDEPIRHVGEGGHGHRRQGGIALVRHGIEPYDLGDQQDAEEAHQIGDRQDIFFSEMDFQSVFPFLALPWEERHKTPFCIVYRNRKKRKWVFRKIGRVAKCNYRPSFRASAYAGVGIRPLFEGKRIATAPSGLRNDEGRAFCNAPYRAGINAPAPPRTPPW